MKVRFIGPYSSGKTTIINLLKEAMDLTTSPTPAYKDQGSIELPFIGKIEEKSLDTSKIPEKVPVTELGGQEKFWEKHKENIDKFTADVDLIIGVFDLIKPDDERKYRKSLESYKAYLKRFIQSSHELDRNIQWGFIINKKERHAYVSGKYRKRRNMIIEILDDIFSEYDDGYTLEEVSGADKKSARRAFFNIYFTFAGEEELMDDICSEVSSLADAGEVAILNREGIRIGYYSNEDREEKIYQQYEGIEEVLRNFEGSEGFALFSNVEKFSDAYLKSGDIEYILAIKVKLEDSDLVILMRSRLELVASLLRISHIKKRIKEILSDVLG